MNGSTVYYARLFPVGLLTVFNYERLLIARSGPSTQVACPLSARGGR